MKKFLIFFIIMVSVMTFGLAKSKKVGVSREKLEKYEQSLVDQGFSKEKIEEYMKGASQIRKTKGMPIEEAFWVSLKFSAIFCGILILLFEAKNSHVNELTGSHFGSEDDTPLRKLQRFFRKMVVLVLYN